MENNPVLIKTKNNLQGGGSRIGIGKVTAEISRNRRALSTINPNIQPCAVVNKRRLQERKSGINDNKNPSIPVNRPITRRFAAQLANKQQSSSSPLNILASQEPKKLKPSNPNQSESEDLLIIDVEESQIS
ncbi:hypothetical protein ACHQM5_003458 [Ranunculus cassubicifolius]